MAAPMSFFARAPPLGNTRTVPALVAPPKRVSTGALPAPKRAKVDKPKLHRALTPERSDGAEPSSDAYADGAPMHPAMHRIRAPPTPSTSTVAASSSPSRRLLSSPTGYRSKARTTAPASAVHLEVGTTLIFGRHRYQPQGTAPPPAVLVPRLVNQTHEARTVALARSARHASRIHAAAELVSTQWGAVVRLVVLGQNGVRVRARGLGRRRMRAGTVAEFAADQPLELDFYGAAVVLRTDEAVEAERQEAAAAVAALAAAAEEHDREERLFTPEPALDRSPMSMPPSSLPPSSPPMFADDLVSEMEMDVDGDDSDVEAEFQDAVSAPTPNVDVHVEDDLDRMSRASSPLSEPEDAEEEEAPAPVDADMPAVALPERAPTPGAVPSRAPTPGAGPSRASTPVTAAPAASRTSTPRPPKSRAATPPAPAEAPPVPAALDLPALLASTVVFSGSSKLSLPDLVKSLLETQPALRDHGDDSVWSLWAAAELDSNPMFGKVSRNGKDSSGRPLLPHYFYNPASDPDPARAKELGGLVRPLRAAQRTGGKVIDWRPVGAGRRRYW
jgi:hypothetical protein